MPTIPADDLADIFTAGELPMDAAAVGAFTIYGVLNNDYIDVLDVTGTQPVFTCRSSDVTLANIVRGSSLIINSITYIVRNLKPAGTGITMLVLELS